MKVIVITSPENIEGETEICNSLFKAGVEILHLRKPDKDIRYYKNYLKVISPEYLNRIVLHGHYELAYEYPVKGIHLKYHLQSEAYQYRDIKHISISCHSLEEIQSLKFKPNYCFLSPLFDSISKQGYHSKFESLPDLNKLKIDIPIIGLGGITPNKVSICEKYGFSGIAVLGYIWEKTKEAINNYLKFLE